MSILTASRPGSGGGGSGAAGPATVRSPSAESDTGPADSSTGGGAAAGSAGGRPGGHPSPTRPAPTASISGPAATRAARLTSIPTPARQQTAPAAMRIADPASGSGRDCIVGSPGATCPKPILSPRPRPAQSAAIPAKRDLEQLAEARIRRSAPVKGKVLPHRTKPLHGPGALP